MVVVTLNIANYDVDRNLIDNERSADILFYDAFSKISISDSRMGLMNSPLVGFTGDIVPVEGIITLQVMTDQYPKQFRVQVNFLMVQVLFAYNAILNQPGLNVL